jgi:hypothetical protein
MLLHMVGSLTHTQKFIREKKMRNFGFEDMSPPFDCTPPPSPPKSSITLLFFGEKFQTNFQKLLQINVKSTFWDGCHLLVLQKI